MHPAALICMIASTSAVEQARAPDVRCGAYCLFIALRSIDLGPGTFEQLETALGAPGRDGYSMKRLADVAETFGAKSMALETSLKNLSSRTEQFTCISIINDNHFVLLYDMNNENVHIVNFPKKTSLPVDVFERIWNKKCLLISKVVLDSEGSINSRVKSRRLARIAGIAGLAAIAAIAVAIGLRRLVVARAVGGVLLLQVLVSASGCGSREQLDDRGMESDLHVPSGGAILELVPSDRDLGVFPVTSEEQVEVKTQIVNRGNEPLFIKGIGLSCSCMDVNLESDRIPPSGTALLTTLITLGNNHGPKSTSIVIESNDPASPKSYLSFKWRIEKMITCDFLSIDMASVNPGDAAFADAKILLRDADRCDDCEVVALNNPHKLNVRIEQFDRDSGGSSADSADPHGYAAYGEVHLAAKDTSAVGEFREVVTLGQQCKGVTKDQISIPISWSVTLPIVAAPSRLSLGTCTGGDSIERTLVLTSSDGKPFVVKSMHMSSFEVSTIEPLGPDPRALHKLDLLFGVRASAGLIRDSLVIETDHDQCQELVVPVSAIIADSSAVN